MPEHATDMDVDAVGEQPHAPSCLRSCQCRSIWRSFSRSTRAPGFARRLVAIGDQQQGLQAVLKLPTYSAVLGSEHEGVRPELAASIQAGCKAKPFGSNGMRRFSLSLVVWPGMPMV